jgi:hypothetical protein
MNPEIKEKWICALESGEYKQCQGRLMKHLNAFDGFGYCCLGVLTDLYIKEKGLDWDKNRYGDFSFEDRDAFLPESVIRISGLSEEEEDVLAQMNDEGASFKVIAQFIRKAL